MRNVDLLLIRPSNEALYPKGERKTCLEPLGLEYIAAYSINHGHSVKILDLERYGSDKGMKKLDETLSANDFRYIGISVFSPLVPEVKKIITILRKCSKAKIIAGGPHVSALMIKDETDILEDIGADIYVCGEGEAATEDILSGKRNGYKYVRGENLGSIDNYPHPSRKLIDRSYIHLDFDFGVEDQVLASVITSRSCPYPCIFCASKAIFGNKIRLRSVEDIEAELKELKSLGVNTLIFLDDTFTIDKKRTLEICKVIKDLGFVYWFDTRVDSVDDEIMQALKDSGCQFIVFGNESGNPDILKRIKKKITIEQIKNAHAIASKYKIATKANFMLGHPGETREQALQTIQLAKELSATKVSFYKVIPLPGTELFDLLNEEEKRDYASYAWYKNPPTVCNMTKEELDELQQIAYQEICVYP